jgi:non-ribosomal peptide synthase protein (TIGR01720 family)
LGLKTTSYQQWAALLKEQAQSERLISQMDYWSGQAWEQARRLPVDYPASEWRNSSARSIMKELSVEETRALLQEVPEAYHTQIIEVLMTALGRTLGEWSGEGAVVVDLEGHGREELREGVELSRTVGWFTAIYPVLLRTSAREQRGSGLKRVKDQIRQIPEKGIGYGMLKYLSEEESVREQMRAIPSASISFNYLGQFDQVSGDRWMKGAEESSGRSESEEGTLRYSLQVNSMVRGGKLETHWTYSREAHEEETIRRVAENYQRRLEEIINHCTSGVGGFTPSDFPEANLSQSELEEILSELSIAVEGE